MNKINYKGTEFIELDGKNIIALPKGTKVVFKRIRKFFTRIYIIEPNQNEAYFLECKKRKVYIRTECNFYNSKIGDTYTVLTNSLLDLTQDNIIFSKLDK